MLCGLWVQRLGGKTLSATVSSDTRSHGLWVLLLLSHFSRVRLCATPSTAAHQAPSSLGFSRQEYWSGLPFPSPMHESEKWKWSRSVMSTPSDPMDCSPPGSSTFYSQSNIVKLLNDPDPITCFILITSVIFMVECGGSFSFPQFCNLMNFLKMKTSPNLKNSSQTA